jgi:hypothetical protein
LMSRFARVPRLGRRPFVVRWMTISAGMRTRVKFRRGQPLGRAGSSDEFAPWGDTTDQEFVRSCCEPSRRLEAVKVRHFGLESLSTPNHQPLTSPDDSALSSDVESHRRLRQLGLQCMRYQSGSGGPNGEHRHRQRLRRDQCHLQRN